MSFIEKVYRSEIDGDALKALTDAIFAVAMTILVLDIKRPESLNALLQPGAYNTYISGLMLDILLCVFVFVILGLIWIGLRHMLEDIHKTDKISLWIMLFLLLGVVLVPLFYSLISEAGQTFPVFTLLFHLNFVIIGICWALEFYYCARKGFMGDVSNIIPKVRNILIFPLTAIIAIIFTLLGYPVSSNYVYIIIPILKQAYLYFKD
ncbi:MULTISPECIES: TMEM175 family protein [unclassified Methanobrevibacter]|jgi:uncharacterized membrane protein|uniref:TMEM175 family protein n=1 Tax=unclassified Methanobrevibacter TaxID=2638681 RepID=UPI0039B9862D